MSEEKIINQNGIYEITREEDFVDKLSSIKSDSNDINFNLLMGDVKNEIDEKNIQIEEFVKNNIDFNNYSEESKDKLYDEVIGYHDELKNLIKNAMCKFNSTGIEIKTIDKKLHQSVEYTTETLFYGLHLKKNFLNNLPKVNGEFEQYALTITFSNAIALYHVLSTLTVKGLNKENFALAHILYTLTEISKVYEYYDNMASRTHKMIMQWNLGLSQEDAKALNQAVTEQLLKEKIEEAEK